MNTPLIIIKHLFPQEILNKIQLYLKNDIIHDALKISFRKTIKKELLYGKFVYYNYIMPNCNCYLYIYPLKCKWCYKYNNTYYYTYSKWYTYFVNNDQLEKINF